MSKHTIYIKAELEPLLEKHRHQINLSEITQMALRRELRYLERLESVEGVKPLINGEAIII